VPTASELRLYDPQTLYRNWEAQQWNPFDVDLSTDIEQWPSLSGDDRDLVF
jgi:ribonucleotide reductase beta subunit family protein with ferritin-like domain